MKYQCGRIFLDLETIPDQREGAASAARSRIRAPSNYKDQAKIDAYIAEKGEEAWRATALDGSYGQLYCIGYALGDDPAEVLAVVDHSREAEVALLESFWRTVDPMLTNDPVWVGHNLLGFDLPFLWRRSVILGVRPARVIPYNQSPWSQVIDDTMLMWSGQRNAYVSLDELLSILGIPSDDLISGADVWDAISTSDDGPKMVIDHCLANVEETRTAWRRMRML
jgi:3'-5' exonuclease